MNCKAILVRTLVLAAFGPALADPVVSNVTLTPAADGRTATVAYDVANGGQPVIVTLDILTNGVSIGGGKIQRLSGDVSRKRTLSSGTITWSYALDWPETAGGLAGVTAKVNAYDASNPPKYMVVSLADDPEDGDRTRYYEDAAFVPGGVSNVVYKTSKVVMRRIPARGVTWTMGSPSTETGRATDGRETEHEVTLAHDYWCAIYPLTCAQMYLGCGYAGQSTVKYDLPHRPVDKLQYTHLRGDDSYGTPDAPVDGSDLAKLRTKTTVDFDLLSEAQWEFACRAGNYGSVWGDGSSILSSTTDSNLGNLARYKRNSGYVWDSSTSKWIAPSAETFAKDGSFAIVGSAKPNDWGLYDMHGNVHEWVIDCYQKDITSLNGAVCTTPSYSSGKILRVIRGGCMSTDASICRSACRSNERSNNWYGGVAGVRLTCQNGLPTASDATIIASASGLSPAVTLGATAPRASGAVAATDEVTTSGGVSAAVEKVVRFLKAGLVLIFN